MALCSVLWLLCHSVFLCSVKPFCLQFFWITERLNQYFSRRISRSAHARVENNIKTLQLTPVRWAEWDSRLFSESDRVLLRRYCSFHRHVGVHRHLRSWSWGGGLANWDRHGFVLPVGERAGPGLWVVQVLLRTVLHRDDAVEGLEAAPQLQVHFTLDVHEDEAASEAYGHDNQLCPEGPLQHTWKETHTHTRGSSC